MDAERRPSGFKPITKPAAKASWLRVRGDDRPLNGWVFEGNLLFPLEVFDKTRRPDLADRGDLVRVKLGYMAQEPTDGGRYRPKCISIRCIAVGDLAAEVLAAGFEPGDHLRASGSLTSRQGFVALFLTKLERIEVGSGKMASLDTIIDRVVSPA